MPSPTNNGRVGRIHNSPFRNVKTESPVAKAPRDAAPASAKGSGDIIDLSSEARGGGVASIDEARETQLMKQLKQQAGLVKIHDGEKKGIHVTVHGIRGNPDVVKKLSEDSAAKGHDVYTLAYDDNKQRLGKSSEGLAASLKQLQAQHPGESITVRTHSMGARVATDALRKLQESGDLNAKVQMENYAPVLGGFGSANSAMAAPGLIAKMIPGAAPGKDMGSLSGFQRGLEGTGFQGNVRTTNFVGSNDDMVDPSNKHFKAVQDGMNATLKMIQGADHDDIMEKVLGGKY